MDPCKGSSQGTSSLQKIGLNSSQTSVSRHLINAENGYPVGKQQSSCPLERRKIEQQSADISNKIKIGMNKSECLAVLQDDGLQLQFIPDDLKNSRDDNRQLSLAAIKNTHEAWQYVSSSLKADQSFVTAVLFLNPIFLEWLYSQGRVQGL